LLKNKITSNNYKNHRSLKAFYRYLSSLWSTSGNIDEKSFVVEILISSVLAEFSGNRFSVVQSLKEKQTTRRYKTEQNRLAVILTANLLHFAPKRKSAAFIKFSVSKLKVIFE